MDSRKFADKMMPFLEKYNNYTDKEKIVAHYGLETLYILVTKMFLIIIMSFIFGIFYETLIFCIIHSILRANAGGIHLKSGIACTFFSLTTFLGTTFFSIYVPIKGYLAGFVFIISFYLFLKYSPADTNKKPIIGAEKRKKRKIYSLITISIFGIIYYLNQNTFLGNCIIYTILLNAVLITPLIYKIFRSPYRNYLIYENLKRKEK